MQKGLFAAIFGTSAVMFVHKNILPYLNFDLACKQVSSAPRKKYK